MMICNSYIEQDQEEFDQIKIDDKDLNSEDSQNVE